MYSNIPVERDIWEIRYTHIFSPTLKLYLTIFQTQLFRSLQESIPNCYFATAAHALRYEAEYSNGGHKKYEIVELLIGSACRRLLNVKWFIQRSSNMSSPLPLSWRPRKAFGDLEEPVTMSAHHGVCNKTFSWDDNTMNYW